MKANILTLVLLLFAVAFLVVHTAHQPWTAARIAGAALGVPALAFLVLARLQLGGSFSLRPEAQVLVTHGLYSRIRNPIYVFGTLVITAFFLYIDQPLALLILVVVVPLQIRRARQETKVLEEKFGEEYRQYRARTWF